MVNCAMMSVDWRTLTWWEYTAMLSAWNARYSDEKPVPDFTALRRAMAVN